MWIWLTAALATLALELALGTVYLLALAAGLALAAPVSLVAHGPWPWATVGIVTFAGALCVKRFKGKTRDEAGDLDAGREVSVDAIEPDGTAYVTYRGARWRARSQSSLAPGRWTIARVDGTELVLEPRVESRHTIPNQPTGEKR